MHSSFNDIDLAENNVNEDLKSVRHWFRRNGLICNTYSMEIQFWNNKSTLSILA